MKPPLFRYEAPRTLRDAVAVLASDPDAMVLAGGQSLVPAMNFRVATPVSARRYPACRRPERHRHRGRYHRHQGDDAASRARARSTRVRAGQSADRRSHGARRARTDPQSRHRGRQPLPCRRRRPRCRWCSVLLDGSCGRDGPAGTRDIAADGFLPIPPDDQRAAGRDRRRGAVSGLARGRGLRLRRVHAAARRLCDRRRRRRRVARRRTAARRTSARGMRHRLAAGAPEGGEAALDGSRLQPSDLAAAARASADAVTAPDDMHTTTVLPAARVATSDPRLVPIAAKPRAREESGR